MSDDCSVVESGETCVCDKPDLFIKSKSDQRIDTKHQLFHTRCSFTAFIANHKNVPRNNLACHNGFICILIAFIHFCRTFDVFYFFIYCCRTYDRSCRRNISPHDFKSRFFCYRIFQRMNDFIWRAFHRIEEFTPSCIPVNRRRVGVDFTGKLLHDLLYTAGIMKIYNCIRSAWNHCIDTVNFLRILFKICQCKLDTKFICVCQDMQYRIG